MCTAAGVPRGLTPSPARSLGSSGPPTRTAETELPFEALFEPYGDPVARLLADRLAQVGLDWQLVRAVAESHEGGPERPAVDGATDLHQPAGAEVLGRPGHDDVGPATLARALLQCCREGLV